MLPLIAASTLATSLAALVGGCGPRAASAPGTARPGQLSEVNTGLAALSSNASAVVLPAPDPAKPLTDAEKAAWAKQSAINLEQLLRDGTVDDLGRVKQAGAARQPGKNEQGKNPSSRANAAKNQPVLGSEPAPQTPADKTTPPKTAASQDANSGLAALGGAASSSDANKGSEDTTGQDQSSAPNTSAPAEAPKPSNPGAHAAPRDDQAAALSELASRMAGLLRQKTQGGKPALSDANALAPLEAMQTGALADLDRADAPWTRGLSSEDLRTLQDARTRVLANPSTAPADLVTALRGGKAPAGFGVARSALCTRVQGFGRFDPYSSTTFVAGRAVRAIVYAELDGFTYRPARAGDPIQTTVAMSEQVSVELTQTLSLFHDRDGLLAWHRPPQTVTECSRSPRRDFYLIQVIELPATLSVGRYNLKVTVADATTGAEAESIIPIEVVADPTLVRATR